MARSFKKRSSKINTEPHSRIHEVSVSRSRDDESDTDLSDSEQSIFDAFENDDTPLTPPTIEKANNASTWLKTSKVSKPTTEPSLGLEAVESTFVGYGGSPLRSPLQHKAPTFWPKSPPDALKSISTNTAAESRSRSPSASPSSRITRASASKTRSRETIKAEPVDELLPSAAGTILDGRPSNRSNEAAKLLDQIISFNIQQRLDENDTVCTASFVSGPNVRCNYRLNQARKKKNGPQSRLKADLSALARHKDNPVDFITQLGYCIESALCGTHQNSTNHATRLGKLVDWLQDPTRGHAIPENGTQMVRLDVNTFDEWVSAISGHSPTEAKVSAANASPTQATPANAAPTKAAPTKAAPTKAAPTKAAPTKAAPTKATQTEVIPAKVVLEINYGDYAFEPWQPQQTLHQPVSHSLYALASAPLGKTKDHLRGSIYMFSVRGAFGLVKIGYTTKTLEQRLGKWNRQCNRKRMFELELLQSSFEGQLVEIPHLARVEKLMHTELKELRLKNKCGACGKTHQEWFWVTEQQALGVFAKWRDWILREPYEEGGDGVWVLKKEFRNELEVVCEPVPFAAAAAATPKRKKGGKKRGARMSGGKGKRGK
ncbi:DUF1766-domain-containing protein [Polyplosphaeria fusca]|uniref:DUF1766-domain-containing protein n=1 Tax=Polyplosphaeria fusca TaxID=682080 RepID=A0A9P4V357_9PLEO|nr:DUF1766-domain-containing protein [Polyplosphaeria fusca]